MAALSGRLAVVTGASSGIGGAIAVAVAASGARLLLLGRDAARLGDSARAAAQRAGDPCGIAELALDLADDDAGAVVAARAAALGGAAILVHSAGIYARGSLAGATIADLDRQYRVNLRAPYLLTQALLPQLTRHAGDIVFVNSTQGLAATAGVGQFAATQHALRAVADALRGEVNAIGIRILTLHVGRTATPRQERIFAAEGRPYVPERLMQPADVAAMVVAAVALPRTAEVTEMTLRPMHKP